MSVTSDRLVRTLLFVPGNDEEKLAKVARFGSDAIVIDLEDAVANDHKTRARAITAAAVGRLGQREALTMVRVNGPGTGRLSDDIEAVVRPGLDAVLAPKVEDTDALTLADAALREAERAAGMPPESVRLIPLIETPRGIVACEAVLAAAPRRTFTAVFGSADYSTELGVEATGAGVAFARQRLVVAARAAGLARPIDGPWLDLADLDGLAADCRASRALGFQGRVIVYPPQVAPAQRAYSEISEAAAQRARRVVDAFEHAEARGVASIRVQGRFIDYPIYRQAQETLRLYSAYRRTLIDSELEER